MNTPYLVVDADLPLVPVHIIKAGNPHHDALTGQFTTGPGNRTLDKKEASEKQEHKEHQQFLKENKQPTTPQSGQLILPESEARQHNTSTNDQLDLKNPQMLQKASQESGGSRVFNFSQGGGDALDKNVKMFTNMGAAGSFERGKLRVEIHPPSGARQVYERSMSELPKLVGQLFAKKYSNISQHRWKTSNVRKSEGNPYHDERGRFAPAPSTKGIEHVANKTGALHKIDDREPDSVLGHNVKFQFGETTIHAAIKETDDEIYLNIISARKSSDATKRAEGTGRGTQIVNALKDYADLTGKKFIVPDATEKAKPYWDKVDFLQRDYGVVIDLDGKPYRPPNTYSYTPKHTQKASPYFIKAVGGGKQLGNPNHDERGRFSSGPSPIAESNADKAQRVFDALKEKGVVKGKVQWGYDHSITFTASGKHSMHDPDFFDKTDAFEKVIKDTFAEQGIEIMPNIASGIAAGGTIKASVWLVQNKQKAQRFITTKEGKRIPIDDEQGGGKQSNEQEQGAQPQQKEITPEQESDADELREKTPGVNSQTVYHGASKESAQYIREHGFGTSERKEGMSSQLNRDFTFVSPSKATANWFASANTRNKSGSDTIEAQLSGKLYEVQKPMPDYAAFGQFAREHNIINETDGTYDLNEIKEKLLEKGFVGIKFKDRDSNNRLTYAVIPSALNVTKAQQFITRDGKRIPIGDKGGDASPAAQADDEAPPAQSKKELSPEQESNADEMRDAEPGVNNNDEMSEIREMAFSSNERYAKRLVSDMGIDENSIEVSRTNHPDDTATEHVGGEYNPDTEKITIYPAAANYGVMELMGTLAHEGMHLKFHQVVKEYNNQKARLENGESLQNLDVYRDIKPALFTERATYQSSAGGISKYADTFWDKYKAEPSTKTYTQAVNETLAEVERLSQAGQDSNISQQWKSLHRKVTNFYKGLQ